MNKIDQRHLAGYDEDFALWSAEQAALIRAERFDRVDLENVAEEIESLARSQRHEIRNRMVVLLQHLLKWEFQPAKRTNSWSATIHEQRDAIASLIEESPSLASHPAAVLTRAYVSARMAASGDTGLSLDSFPEDCPYGAAQVVDLRFLPETVGRPRAKRARRRP